MNAADVMTKALSGQSFQRALEMLRIARLRGSVENMGVKQRACSVIVNYGNKSMSLCVCHLRARCASAHIGDAAEKARFDVSMTGEIVSNTTAHILYGKLGVTAVVSLAKTTALFLLRK
jgi:hypothetical protein